MNTNHEITPEQLSALGAKEAYDDKANHVTISDVVGGYTLRADDFGAGIEIVDHNHEGGEDTGVVFSRGLLQALDKAGFVVVKKNPVLPDPRINHPSEYVL